MRTRFFRVLPQLLILGALLASLASAQELTSKDLLTQGLAAAKSKDYATAKSLLTQVVTKDPNGPYAAEAAWKLGYIANQELKPDAARTWFDWVIANHPKGAKAADSMLSLAMMDRRAKPFKSLGILTDITRQFPTRLEAKVAKVRIAGFWNDRREFEKALEVAGQVLADSGAPPSLKASAAVEMADGHLGVWRYKGSTEHLQAAITLLEEMPAKYPGALKEVALSQVKLAIHFISPGRPSADPRFGRDPAKARAIMQDALAKLPLNYCTWWMKVEVMASYQAEGRWQDALTECDSVLSQSPPASWREYLLYMKGDYQLRLEQKEAGIASLKQVISDYPDSTWAKLAQQRIAGVTGGEQK